MAVLGSSSAKITDDRGRPVPVWSGARRGNDAFEQDLAIRLAHMAQLRTQRIGCFAIPLFMLAFVGLSMLGLPAWGSFIPAAFILLFLVLVGRWSRQAERARIRPTLLGVGRCASCAYPIARIPAEADGCVPCPECGAAWKFDPEWGRRLDIADSAAEENLNLPKEGTADDKAAIQLLGRFFGGLTGRRSLAMQDERGRLATIFFPRFPWKDPARWSEVTHDHQRALRREIRLLGWPWRVLFIACFALPAIINLWVLSNVPPGATVPRSMHIFTFFWLFVFLPLAIFGIAIFPHVRKPRNMARLFLRRGLCPGCAADLSKVAPAADGCRECGHCLSAWKLEEPNPDSTSPTHTPPNPPVARRSG